MCQTGYESYTSEERKQLLDDLQKQLKQEQWCSEGDGLRAEIARATVREIQRQIQKIISAKPFDS